MLVEHLVASVVAAILGMILGSALAYLFHWVMERIRRHSGQVEQWLAILPWRTLLVAPPLLYLATPALSMRTPLRLGRPLGVLVTALFVAEITIPVAAALLRQRSQLPSTLDRAASWVRTLLVASVPTSMIAALAGGGTTLAQRFFMAQNLEQGSAAFRLLFLGTLALDVIAGIVQFIIVKAQPAHSQSDVGDVRGVALS